MKKCNGWIQLTVSFILLVGYSPSQIRGSDGGFESTADEDFYTDHPLLEQYIREALERNPALDEAIARYRASLQKIPQVKSLPDPMLTFTQWIRSPETRVGPQSNITAISQKIPWFGKLDLQGQVMAKEAVAQYQMYEIRRREIIADVKRTFYEVAFVDRSLGLIEDEELLLDHFEKMARSRYAQGYGLQQGVIKIQAELTQLLDRRKILNQQREGLVARLNTLMDRAPEAQVPEIRDLHLPRTPLNLAELYGLGEENRPELKASLARIEKMERATDLAKKDYWPDLTLTAGLVNVEKREDLAGIMLPPPDNGKNAFSFAVGVNIPIWRSKYRAEVVEATEGAIAERRGYMRTLNEIELSIREQVIRLQTLEEQMELYDSILLVQAEEALKSAEAAYETGQATVLDLLDSERFLIRSRLIRERYFADYLRSLADLERAIGTKFPRI